MSTLPVGNALLSSPSPVGRWLVSLARFQAEIKVSGTASGLARPSHERSVPLVPVARFGDVGHRVAYRLVVVTSAWTMGLCAGTGGCGTSPKEAATGAGADGSPAVAESPNDTRGSVPEPPPRQVQSAGVHFCGQSVDSDMTSLTCDHPSLDDLTPLVGLTKLESLDLSGTRVRDLAPLKGLFAWRSLDLSGTLVKDLAPLAALTELAQLNLRDVPVADLMPLAGLSKLRWLDLHATRVQDLEPLAALTALG